MSAESRLTQAAVERLADLDVAVTLAASASASALQKATDAYHRLSETARDKLGAFQDAQRSRHAELHRLVMGIRCVVPE